MQRTLLQPLYMREKWVEKSGTSVVLGRGGGHMVTVKQRKHFTTGFT